METSLAAVYYPAGGGTETAWDPEALISHVVHGEGQGPDLEWTDPGWRQVSTLGASDLASQENDMFYYMGLCLVFIGFVSIQFLPHGKARRVAFLPFLVFLFSLIISRGCHSS